jgi:hypothetical protein
VVVAFLEVSKQIEGNAAVLKVVTAVGPTPQLAQSIFPVALAYAAISW